MVAQQETRMCPVCGKMFKSVRADHYFCSDACATSWWREQNRKAPKVELECPICGKYFTRTHGHQKYCSKNCMKKAWAKRNPEKVKKKQQYYDALKKASHVREVECVVCGTKFLTTDGHKNTCSEECKRLNKNQLALKYYNEKKAKELPKELGPLSPRQRSQIITGLKNALKYFSPQESIEEVLSQIEAEDINYKFYSVYE